MKLKPFLEWSERTGIFIGDTLKISFYHRGSVLAQYDLILDKERLLILRPPKGEKTLDLPTDPRTGAYVIPLGLIRSVEKIRSYGRQKAKRKRGVRSR